MQKGSNRSKQENIESPSRNCRRRAVVFIAIPASPSWHRHLRGRRSRIRQAVRKGRVLSQSRLQLLALHHGTCPFRRRLLLAMGRGRDRNFDQWTDTERRQDRAGKWRLWSGAASSAEAPWWPTQAKNKAKPSFPTYSGIAARHPPATPANGAQLQMSEPGGLVTDMQAALNVARKAEIRVNRLHAAYEAAQDNWATYDQLAKENYQRERRRYQKDLERIEKEAVEAEAQQQRSREAVLRIANGQTPEPLAAVPAPPDAQVAALFETWAAEDGNDLDGVFQRALHAQAPNTPTGVRTSAPMTPVPAARPSPARATDDPYFGTAGHVQVSPAPTGAAVGGLLSGVPPGLSPGFGQHPKHPGQRDKSLLRAPTTDAPPRQGIKEATKGKAAPTTGHVSWEAKLQEKRESMRNALHPFGVAPRTPAPPAAPEESLLRQWQGLASMTVEDDDPDLADTGQAPLTELE